MACGTGFERAATSGVRRMQEALPTPTDARAMAVNLAYARARALRHPLFRAAPLLGGSVLKTSASPGASKFSGHDMSVAFELLPVVVCGLVPQNAALENALGMCASSVASRRGLSACGRTVCARLVVSHAVHEAASPDALPLGPLPARCRVRHLGPCAESAWASSSSCGAVCLRAGQRPSG